MSHVYYQTFCEGWNEHGEVVDSCQVHTNPMVMLQLMERTMGWADFVNAEIQIWVVQHRHPNDGRYCECHVLQTGGTLRYSTAEHVVIPHAELAAA